MPVQLQKDILRDLFRQSTVTGHAPCQRKRHGLVLVHQLLEIRLPSLRHGFRFYLLIRRPARSGMQKLRVRTKKCSDQYSWEEFPLRETNRLLHTTAGQQNVSNDVSSTRASAGLPLQRRPPNETQLAVPCL